MFPACSPRCERQPDVAHRDHPVTDYKSVVDDTTQFLDVRQPHEFAAATLPGAINVPLDVLTQRVAELDPQRRVVLLCRSGGRSTTAAKMLSSHGFADVVNLEGGMLAYGGRR